MKKFKKMLAIALAMVMVLSMSISVFADETSQHTIKITNTDQNVSHTYEGYQIFKGKLDAAQQKMSDIVWGEGVDGDALLTALKASTDSNLMTAAVEEPGSAGYVAPKNLFTDCTTAADVAKVFATFQSTDGATSQSGPIDAVAKIIGETSGILNSGKKISFTENNKEYSATVTGDGYYFVKDATTTLTDATTKGSDTLSKYLLAVVKDTTIVAKDTHLTPDKEILQTGGTTVKEGTAAVGDTVTFQVTIKVPDTRKYVDHFIFDMKDKLPAGMTFMGITSVKVGEDSVPYTLTVAPAGSTTYAAYTAPTDAATAVTTAGGQQIKLVFNNFKTFAEGKDGRIGSDMVVTYTAVVNDDADFTPTGNKNEVVFDYSNDPNHDYDGDEPDSDEPMGVTPKDETNTKLINIEIQKTGDNGSVTALAGAEFEITSDDYNVTLVTGEKMVASDYTLPASGESWVGTNGGTWYKLKDGSYTETAPTDQTASSYESRDTTYKKVAFSKSNTTPGTTKKVTVISGEDGKIKLEGLKPGTYSIKETKAPEGYNLDTNTYTIKVNWTYDATSKTGSFAKDETSSNGVAWDGTNAKATITIDNKGGTQLPSTGGMGTRIFKILGTILVLGAGILLVTRRRMNAQ
jgi:LPXTG-motif cell wall-anchored protein